MSEDDCGMNFDLDPVASALADMNDHESDALIATVNYCLQLAPGFLACVKHVCEQEWNRRYGLDAWCATQGSSSTLSARQWRFAELRTGASDYPQAGLPHLITLSVPAAALLKLMIGSPSAPSAIETTWSE